MLKAFALSLALLPSAAGGDALRPQSSPDREIGCDFAQFARIREASPDGQDDQVEHAALELVRCVLEHSDEPSDLDDHEITITLVALTDLQIPTRSSPLSIGLSQVRQWLARVVQSTDSDRDLILAGHLLASFSHPEDVAIIATRAEAATTERIFTAAVLALGFSCTAEANSTLRLLGSKSSESRRSVVDRAIATASSMSPAQCRLHATLREASRQAP